MWNKIKKYVGQHYIFRLDGILASGFFCGIGEVNNNYGMIFIGTEYGKNKNGDEYISLTSCLVVHPSRIKCTLYSDILSLRKSCRKLFRKNKYTNHSEDIYHPSFDIKEITDEKRVKTKR